VDSTNDEFTVSLDNESPSMAWSS